MYFPKTNWPDFRRKELEEAVAEFGRRQRRYGAIG
jgi:undecaprenyl pyrophosphate synthase